MSLRTVIRPLGAADDPSPARSLGLAYAPVDPGAHNLDAAFEVSETADPRGPLEVALRVDGVAEGETALGHHRCRRSGHPEPDRT